MSLTIFKDIFISYRRDTGVALATIIKSKIETRSVYSCFLDIENLGSGDFVKALVPYIEQASAMIIVLTEGYIERCARPGDICVKEITHALKKNKQLIVVTSIARKELRDIVANTANLPQEIISLMDYNIFYIRPGDVIEESIDRIIQSINETKVKNIADISLAINRSYIREKVNRDIRIGPYEFEYTGSRIGNYLIGYGTLVCLDSIDLSIEGNFSCDINSIAGEVKVIFNGATVFNGILSKIDSIVPLKITGTGTYAPNSNNIYNGFVEKGLYLGNGTHRNLATYQTYTGYFKDSKKHGPGVLKVQSASYDAIIKTNFFEGTPRGETILEDYKNSTLIVANINNRKVVSKILLYSTRLDNYAETLLKEITPAPGTIITSFGATLDKNGKLETLTAYQNRRELAKLVGLNKPRYLSIHYPYNDRIDRVEASFAADRTPDDIIDHTIYAKDGTTVNLSSTAIINSDNYIDIPGYWKSKILTTQDIVKVAKQVELFAHYYISIINSLNSYLKILNIL